VKNFKGFTLIEPQKLSLSFRRLLIQPFRKSGRVRGCQGFTLIELLVVITIIAIAIVVLLSAINPMEQIGKARDAARLKDAADLLGAYGRYYGSFKCFPWDPGAPDCTGESDSRLLTATVTDFYETGVDYELITQGKLKKQFANKRSIERGELLVSHDNDRRVSVCFEPESKKGRTGSFIPLMDNINQIPVAGNQCADLDGYPDESCFICVSF
jgi:prepilin-type N-terminal cleavage/methylation domain-containing protein